MGQKRDYLFGGLMDKVTWENTIVITQKAEIFGSVMTTSLEAARPGLNLVF